jgi:hypothetical protein
MGPMHRVLAGVQGIHRRNRGDLVTRIPVLLILVPALYVSITPNIPTPILCLAAVLVWAGFSVWLGRTLRRESAERKELQK